MSNLNFHYDCHNDFILCAKVVQNYGGNAALILKCVILNVIFGKIMCETTDHKRTLIVLEHSYIVTLIGFGL